MDRHEDPSVAEDCGLSVSSKKQIAFPSSLSSSSLYFSLFSSLLPSFFSPPPFPLFFLSSPMPWKHENCFWERENSVVPLGKLCNTGYSIFIKYLYKWWQKSLDIALTLKAQALIDVKWCNVCTWHRVVLEITVLLLHVCIWTYMSIASILQWQV